MDCNTSQREMKRRFFRKKGLSRPESGGGGSLDNPSFSSSRGSSSSSPSNSLDHPIPESIQQQYGLVVQPPQQKFHRNRQLQPNQPNSSSLDEADFKMNSHQHRSRPFMGAPRRARSAERFDGMRIYSNSNGSHSPAEYPPAMFSSPNSAEFHSRNQAAIAVAFSSLPPHQQQQIRNGLQLQGRQHMVVASPVPASTKSTPSSTPPPPYISTLSDKNMYQQQQQSKQYSRSSSVDQMAQNGGPLPTYKQAMNAMNNMNNKMTPLPQSQQPNGKLPTSLQQNVNIIRQQNIPITTTKPTTNPKYSMMNQRSAQSFDTGLGQMGGGSNKGLYYHNNGLGGGKNFGGLSSGNKLIKTSSVPAFIDEESLCNCSKCQTTQKQHENSFNDDAVYMESQAFLMHEIMTDGMAFCTIM